MDSSPELTASRDLLFSVKELFPKLHTALNSIPHDIELYREYIHSKSVSNNRRLLIQDITPKAGPLYALAALCPRDTPNSLDDAPHPDDVLHLLKALNRRIMLKKNYAILFRLLSFYESLPVDVHELFKQHMSNLLAQSTGEKCDLKKLFRYTAMVLEHEIVMTSPWATNRPGIVRGLQSMMSQEFLLSAPKHQMQKGFAILLGAYKERQELFERLFQDAFSGLNVHETSAVLRKLITAIDPTKSYTHPYIGGEKTRPEWWPSGFPHTDVQGFPALEKRRLLTAISRITDMTDILEAAMTIPPERGSLMHAKINWLSQISIVARYRALIDYER